MGQGKFVSALNTNSLMNCKKRGYYIGSPVSCALCLNLMLTQI